MGERAVDDERAWAVRRHVYAVIAARGVPPTADEAAVALGLPEGVIRAAFARLHELHALFLDPATGQVRMAHPFSGVATGFRVRCRGVDYWANCAWDALGIPAALGADATVAATYADGGAPAALRVAGGRVEGAGVVHFLRPFRRWYDDLIET